MVWAHHYDMLTTFERLILPRNQSKQFIINKFKNSAPKQADYENIISKICDVCFVSITSNFYNIQFSNVTEVVILHKEI
jgi:hypothetical protein